MTTQLLRLASDDEDSATLFKIPEGMRFDEAKRLANAVIRTVNAESGGMDFSTLFETILERLTAMGFAESGEVHVENLTYWDDADAPDEADTQLLAAYAARKQIAGVLEKAAARSEAEPPNAGAGAPARARPAM